MRGERVGKRRASWQERTELHRCYGLAIGPNAKGSLRPEYSEYPRALEEYPQVRVLCVP